MEMKIAFVYDIPYPWHKGGIEHILNVEAEELAKKHEVHFFTMKWPGMDREFEYNNVKYHSLGDVTEETAYRHGRRSIREAMSFTFYLNRIFNYNFDVIISNAFPVLHLPVVKTYCRLKKARLILKVDEVWDRDYWVSYLGAVAGDAANAYANTFIRSESAYYVANSSETAKRLEGIGVPGRRIRVFAPVLEDQMIKKIARQSKRNNTIFFSGRLIKEKKIDKWLHVVKKVIEKDKKVDAMLVGEGTERKRIMHIRKRLGLEKKVKMVPFFKDKEELYRSIASSKVLLHMSEREGLGIIALESLALGTPVVLPDYSPIPKEVKEMCIVASEEEIPSKIIQIMNRNGNYIRNTENLKMFSTSSVISFYDNLFKHG